MNRWGPYAEAVTRWERATRPAPAPTDERGRLAPEFVEWIMGLPDGWVTATPGLSRPAQLTALGNGVVPQQAAHALRMLHPPLPRRCTSPGSSESGSGPAE
jgi:DNA (cytosine-5)-methyltransferase 1